MFDDEFSENSFAKSTVKPFHKVIDKPDKDILEWLNTVSKTLEKQATSRHRLQRDNLEAYRGNVAPINPTSRFSERPHYNRVNKFVINHLYDITETKVSQLCRIKPSVDILPTNDEFEDKNAAKAVKFLINHIWYLNDMDSTLQKMQRYARILERLIYL